MTERTEHQPIPKEQELVVLGKIVERRGGHEEFTLQRGYSPDLIEQLVEKSKQAEITKFCPKDEKKRFTDPEAFANWVEKDGGRTTYFLTDEDGELAGLVWYGQAAFEHEGHESDADVDPNHTFAIRMYEGYAGRGLAKQFMLDTTRDYVEQLQASGQMDDFNGIHLETDTINPSSIPLYHKVGYEDVHTDDEKGRITMVLSPERIHEICS